MDVKQYRVDALNCFGEGPEATEEECGESPEISLPFGLVMQVKCFQRYDYLNLMLDAMISKRSGKKTDILGKIVSQHSGPSTRSDAALRCQIVLLLLRGNIL